VLMLVWVWYVGTAVVSVMADAESQSPSLDGHAFINKH
jgi:hypothetical protein